MHNVFIVKLLLISIIVFYQLYVGIALIIIVFINGGISFYQQWKSEKIKESFKCLIPLASIACFC